MRFKHFRSTLLILACCLCTSLLANGQDPFVLSGWQGLTDTSYQLTIENVKHLPFEEISGVNANLGVKHEPTWLKVVIPPVREESYLELGTSALDSVYMYQVANGQVIAADTTGTAYAFSSRKVNSPLYVMELANHPRESTVYLRIQSGKQVILPARISGKYSLLWEQNKMDIFFALYSGVILVMFLYNLFVWFSVRDRNYLYYVMYILAVGLTQLILNGYGDQYFWPNNTWLGLRAVHYSGVLSGMTTLVFARGYLQIPKHAKWLDRLLIFYACVYVVAFVAATFGLLVLSFNLINFCALFSIILIIGAIRIWRKGYKPAQYFLIAWSIFLVGVTVFVLKDFGVFPYNNVTRFALPVGSALEVVLLSFALADRMNVLKREREKEREEKLEVLQENERIITEQNVMLEAKVEERTKELETSNAELNSTLNELQSTQAQLVDAEKMASLGQMTAGIAHELNNPINFVSSNIVPLKRDLEDVFKILDAYSKSGEEEDKMKERLDEAKELSEELEVDFLKEEISMLLKGIADGADRTAEIVKGLRIFSRLDEDALKKADINECIESTLVILKSIINNEAPVIRTLDKSIGEINCFPGKLNQVFMNILANALQAAKATGKPYEERKVEVITEQTDHEVIVRIKDNGIGMPDEVKAKIFDPFFTTKEVGQGTGLGLSIVLGIINAHKGRIDVESTAGEGTEFILHLSKAL